MTKAREGAIAGLAGRQRTMVAHEQLIALRCSRRGIAHWVKRGRLHPVFLSSGGPVITIGTGPGISGFRVNGSIAPGMAHSGRTAIGGGRTAGMSGSPRTGCESPPFRQARVQTSPSFLPSLAQRNTLVEFSQPAGDGRRARFMRIGPRTG